MPGRLLFQSSFETIRDKLLQWNVYDCRSSDALVIRRGIFSTRLYILLLLLCFVILTTFTSFRLRIKNEIVFNPTQSVYGTILKGNIRIVYNVHVQKFPFLLANSSTSFQDFIKCVQVISYLKNGLISSSKSIQD